jgi:hypothetical protein
MAENSLTELSIKQVRLIGIMLLLSQVAFLLVVMFLVDKQQSDGSMGEAFRLVVPAMAAMVVPAAYIFFSKFIQAAKAQPQIYQRLARYRTAVIVKLAMLEGILLFIGVALMLSQEYFLLIVWAIVFALMLTSVLSAVRRSFVEEIAQGDSRVMA